MGGEQERNGMNSEPKERVIKECMGSFICQNLNAWIFKNVVAVAVFPFSKNKENKFEIFFDSYFQNESRMQKGW